MFFEQKMNIFRKNKISENRKIEILKNHNFEKSKIFRDFENFRKNIFSKKYFSIEKMFDRFFFSMNFFRNIMFVNPHSSGMPPALPGVMQRPCGARGTTSRTLEEPKSIDFASLDRLAQAELLTIRWTTVERFNVWFI